MFVEVVGLGVPSDQLLLLLQLDILARSRASRLIRSASLSCSVVSRFGLGATGGGGDVVRLCCCYRRSHGNEYCIVGDTHTDERNVSGDDTDCVCVCVCFIMTVIDMCYYLRSMELLAFSSNKTTRRHKDHGSY